MTIRKSLDKIQGESKLIFVNEAFSAVLSAPLLQMQKITGENVWMFEGIKYKLPLFYENNKI